MPTYKVHFYSPVFYTDIIIEAENKVDAYRKAIDTFRSILKDKEFFTDHTISRFCDVEEISADPR